MIARELTRLVCAIQFLTRLPTPRLSRWDEDLLARSARYFPAAGLLVGGLTAAVFFAARRLWPAGVLPALLAVAAGVAITGGFHEDGLADTADGLGGGQTPEQRLAIMKDSRIGSYGALALGLMLALKIAGLASLPAAIGAAALLAAHALGRAAAGLAMWALPYAADPGASKLKPVARDVRLPEAAFGLVIALLPVALLPPRVAAAGLAAGGAAALWPALTARRLIGGYTGDVLGAIEQVFETFFLLGVAGALAGGLA
jgi:adenosylcobinamide-GDP ribazoletransferase